ncbi:MAG: hypothetical protein ACKO01_08675 [Erythrobacter sp.]
MHTERFLVGLHGAAAVLALGASTLWPRPGQAAQLVPLPGNDLAGVLGWARREGAPLLELDTARGRVIARLPGDGSLLRALGAGVLPLTARPRDCQPRSTP